MSILNQTITKKLKNFIKGETVENSTGQFSNQLSYFSSYFNSLNSCLPSLKDRVSRGREIGTMFSMDPDLYDYDKSVDYLEPLFCKVSDQLAQSLVANLIGKTLTDSNGYPYEFINGGQVVFEGITVDIQTQPSLSRIQDIFMYHDEHNEYYVNNRLRSVGFYDVEEDVYTPPSTLANLILEVGDWMDWPIDPEDYANDRLRIFIDWVDSFDGDTTEMTYLALIREIMIYNGSYDEYYDGTIIGSLQGICIYERNKYYHSYGKITWLMDLARDILLSNDLNECMLDACDQLLSGKFDPNTFTSSYTNVTDSAQSFRNGLVSAYGVGGVIGSIKYILSYFNGIQNTQVDENGFMTLTDNNSFIPQEYIAGIITTVVGSVVSIAGALLTLISVPLGLAVSAIGSIISAIPQAINYDYKTATTGSIVDDSTVYVLPYAPIACMQGHVNIDTFKRSIEDIDVDIDNIISNLGEDYPMIMLNVPGGLIIIGKYSDTEIAYEFHPGFLDTSTSQVNMFLINKHSYSWYDGNPTDWSADCYDFTITTPTIDNLYKFYFTSNPCNVNNNDYGVMDENDDSILVGLLYHNTCLFFLWLRLVVYKYDHDLIYKMFGLEQTAEAHFPIVQINTRGADSHTLTVNTDYDWAQYALCCFMNPNKPVYYIDTKICNYAIGSPISWSTLVNEYLLHDGIFNGSYLNYIWISDLNFQYSTPVWPAVTETYGDIYNEFKDSDQYYQLLYNSKMSSTYDIVSQILYNKYFYDQINFVNGDYTFGVKVPKYNRSTFILWTALSIAAVALAVTTAIIVSVNVKKWRRNKSNQLARNAETAWEDYKDNPSKENYNAYIKSVKKNNRWSAVTGGTKYSTNGFWASDSSLSATMRSEDNTRLSELQYLIPGMDNKTDIIDDDIVIIRKLIKGN